MHYFGGALAIPLVVYLLVTAATQSTSGAWAACPKGASSAACWPACSDAIAHEAVIYLPGAPPEFLRQIISQARARSGSLLTSLRRCGSAARYGYGFPVHCIGKLRGLNVVPCVRPRPQTVLRCKQVAPMLGSTATLTTKAVTPAYTMPISYLFHLPNLTRFLLAILTIARAACCPPRSAFLAVDSEPYRGSPSTIALFRTCAPALVGIELRTRVRTLLVLVLLVTGRGVRRAPPGARYASSDFFRLYTVQRP